MEGTRNRVPSSVFSYSSISFFPAVASVLIFFLAALAFFFVLLGLFGFASLALSRCHHVSTTLLWCHVGSSWSFALRRGLLTTFVFGLVSFLLHLLRAWFRLAAAHCSGDDTGACSTSSCSRQCLADGVTELGRSRAACWRRSLVATRARALVARSVILSPLLIGYERLAATSGIANIRTLLVASSVMLWMRRRYFWSAFADEVLGSRLRWLSTGRFDRRVSTQAAR